MDSKRIEELIICHRRGLLEDTIPFWLNHTIDREFGGFLNYMDADGQLFSVSFGAESAPGVFSLFNNNGTQFLFGDATSFTKAAIPEPTALLTMLPALLFGGFRRMRRRQTSS